MPIEMSKFSLLKLSMNFAYRIPFVFLAACFSAGQVSWIDDGFAQAQSRPKVKAVSALALRSMSFILEGIVFKIVLPENAVLHDLAGKSGVRFDLTKDMRLERTLTFSMASIAASTATDRTKNFKNGNRLEYHLDDDPSGGSGGPVAEIVGKLSLESYNLSVSCTDQDEWSPDAEWCLSFLSSLEIVRAVR